MAGVHRRRANRPLRAGLTSGWPNPPRETGHCFVRPPSHSGRCPRHQGVAMRWPGAPPDATPCDYLDRRRPLIARFGWWVQGVERDRIHPPWAYTVGLAPRGLPELVVTGLPLRRATGLLNGVAAHAVHASAPTPGE